MWVLYYLTNLWIWFLPTDLLTQALLNPNPIRTRKPTVFYRWTHFQIPQPVGRDQWTLVGFDFDLVNDHVIQLVIVLNHHVSGNCRAPMPTVVDSYRDRGVAYHDRDADWILELAYFLHFGLAT